MFYKTKEDQRHFEVCNQAIYPSQMLD